MSTNGATAARKTPVPATASTAASRAQSPSTTNPPAAPPKKTTPTSTQKAKVSKQQDDDPNSTTRRCKHCKNQVPKDGFDKHSKNCLRQKKEEKKKREEVAKRANGDKDAVGEPDDAVPNGSQPATNGADVDGMSVQNTTETVAKPSKKEGKKKDAAANGKKRKADIALDDAASVASSATGSKPPTKKMKKKDATATPTAKETKDGEKKTGGGGGGKPKGPVDVERQCGVLLPNAAMCARSLTCKSHSMGAKRSVPGRSLPYDVLLANYQKKNQARQQKERMAANANAAEEDGNKEGAAVDSDEERERVMNAIARARPKPLTYETDIGGNFSGMAGIGAGGALGGIGCEQYVTGSVAKRYRNVRLKEMLGNALGGSRGGGLFSISSAGKERAYTNTDGITESAPLSATGPQSAGLGGSRRQSSVGGEHMRRGSDVLGDTAMAS